MISRRVVGALVVLCAGLSSVGVGYGQAVGSILGSVTDPSGAVIASAKIVAVQSETGLERSTITSHAGTYTLPNLPVGSYRVTASAAGFNIVTNTSVTLDVSQQRQVDFSLSVSGSSARVEVSAVAAVLPTASSSLDGLVSGQQVADLPLNGRDILNLVLLQPGMNYETGSTFNYYQPMYASNGNRGQTTVSSLDGIDSSDTEFGTLSFSNFNPDAIDEFKILTNNYSAEYGQGGGTVVQLVSKSGTNSLHGSLFEFLRNSAFDARNYFSSTVPPLQRNEFGGTIGGPVVIPHLYNGKDHSFFFFEYAGFRQRLGEPVIISVPTAGERNGIVPITGSNGSPDSLLVPLNPAASQALNLYPMPNDPTGPYGANTFNDQYKIPENHDQYSGRFDEHISDHDSMFVRFTYINDANQVADPFAAVLNPQYSAQLHTNSRNFGLSETHIFSPTLMNTAKFGITRMIVTNQPQILNVTQAQFNDGSLGQFGPDTSVRDWRYTTFTLHDGINWVKGRQSLSIGFEARRGWDNGFGASSSGPAGFYTFGPGVPVNVTIPSQSGQNNVPKGTPSSSGLISFMLGQPESYGRAIALPGFSFPPGSLSSWGVRRYYLNGWIQDDIQVTRSLTLNLGFRYEYNSVPNEVANHLSAVVNDPHYGGGNLYGHFILNPSPLYKADYTGFGPRFGLAYKVDPKTVLRGGFSIFTNNPPTTFADQAAANFPFASFVTSLNPTYSLTPPSVTGVPALTSLSGAVMPPNGDTRMIPRNTPVSLAPIAAYFGGPILTNLTSVDFRNGYTMAGNVTISRELPGQMLLQTSYVMNNAVHLYSSSIPNGYTGAQSQYTPFTNVTPGLGEVELLDNHAHSTYNALQASVRKTSDKAGMQFQVSYTYSKAIDNASTSFYSTSVPDSAELLNNPLCTSCERSVSAFDFTHRLVTNVEYAVRADRWNALHKLPSRVTKGWQLNTIISAQSGFPFTVNSPYGTDQFGADTFYGFQPTRPDLLQTPTLASGNQPQFFSDSVIGAPQQYFGTPLDSATGLQTHPGDLGRNTFRTHPFSNADFSLLKDTDLTERTKLQFRAEFFNLLNQHAFTIPSAILGSPAFGLATSTVLPERQIQFALRLFF